MSWYSGDETVRVDKIVVAPTLNIGNGSRMIDFIRKDSPIKIKKENGMCLPPYNYNCNEYQIDLAVRNEFAEEIHVETTTTECKELAMDLGNDANSQYCGPPK